MAKTKGTDVVALRSVLRDRGSDLEQRVRGRLGPAARDVYDKALAVSWSPVDLQMEVYRAAAAELFPDSREPMADLGSLLARHTYRGIYKVFLRIPSVSFILSRAADMWSSFYDTGKATIENSGPRTADLVVTGFPDLPAPMREMARGHITALLELAGCNRPLVRHLAQDASAWRWRASWE